MPRLRAGAAAGLISLLAATAVAGVHQTFETESDARQRRGVEIAAALVQPFSSLLETFKAQRRELRLDTTGESYLASDVASLLESTEIALQAALDGPDLAPLRNYVAEGFRSVRDRLKLPHTSALGREHRPFHILPASFATEKTVDRNDAEAAFDWVMAFMEKVLSRSKSQQLTVNLCVVTHPEGASFTMSASGLAGKPYETRTMGEVLNAFRGLYEFELKKDTKAIGCRAPLHGEAWSCRPINLWDDGPVLDCDLSQPPCQHRETKLGDCPRRKR